MASIRQFRNGRWQGQVRQRGLVPTTKTFGTKWQAERWARLVESEIDRGVFVDRSEAERTTVAELIERYLTQVTPGKKSWRNEAQRLRFLARRFGRYSAAGIRTPDLVQYRDQRLKAGLAPSTVAKELNSLSMLFDTAIRDWGLPLISNPVKLVRRPAPGKARERRLLPGEEEKILAACRASQAQLLAAIVELAIHTGMRLGELLAFDWRNVDFAGRVAWLPETKTGEGRRVPLSSRAVAILSQLPRHISDPRVFWLWTRVDSFETAGGARSSKPGSSICDFMISGMGQRAGFSSADWA